MTKTSYFHSLDKAKAMAAHLQASGYVCYITPYGPGAQLNFAKRSA